MKFLKVKHILTSNTKPIDNVLCYEYSVFQTFHRKKDSQSSKRVLIQKVPLSNYLCDVTFPARDHVSVSLKDNNITEIRGVYVCVEGGGGMGRVGGWGRWDSLIYRLSIAS